MKKILAILMALCMFCGVAMAEAATELNWDEIAPIIEQSGVAGDFVTFDEIAVKIWIPEGMNSVELAQEDIDKGFIGLAVGGVIATVVAIVAVFVLGTKTDAEKAAEKAA